MLINILEESIEKSASDIHLTKGLPPMLRIDGVLESIDQLGILEDSILKGIAGDLVDEGRYAKRKYLDTSFVYKDFRFRVHVYRQRGVDAITMRLIPSRIPAFDELNLPESIRKFTALKSGLVLITGKTGAGKTTTLASLINDINENQCKHIITIEDPIEFIHEHKKSMINQKEVGMDVHSFADAVRSAMREDPDILLVGEMRDLETIQNAITMAETGHLVFATLHTNNAAESVDRAIDVFPHGKQDQIRIQFANVIQGIVSQQLLPKTGGGRVPLCEVLIANGAIRALIKEKSPPSSINDQLQMNYKKNGSQGIYQGLINLYKNQLIDYPTAMEYAGESETFKGMLDAMRKT